MQKFYTSILWEFQSYQSSQICEVYHLDSFLEPDDFLSNLFLRLEENLPEISEETLQKILATI